MAKKKIKPIKFNDNYLYPITPKSKNLTFEYTGAGSYTFDVETGFTLITGKEIYGYKGQYQNFAFKSGDNLILKTMFTKDSGKAKIVTTIIKNYFADDTKDYKFTFDSYKYYYASGNQKDKDTFTIKPNTEEGVNGLFKVMTEDTGDTDFILGTSGNDTITIATGGGDWVYDTKGNDTYNNQASDYAYLYDLGGKDTYNTTAESKTYAYDYKGNDTYHLDDDGSLLIAQDYAGNDTYNVNVKGNSSADFWIDDFKGNDFYFVSKNSGENHRINDSRGNDNYRLIDANICVIEHGGNDKFEISGNDTKVEITDDGKGNDKYKVKDISGMTYDNLAIADYRGNESYTFTNVKADWNTYVHATDDDYTVKDDNGSDKYTFDNSGHIIIKDAKGNDKYTARNGCENIDICDESGKDKYYFTDNDYYSFILDKKGNDKYKFTVSNTEIGCDWITVRDYEGKDSYTIVGKADKHARSNAIHDESTTSKDKYNFAYADNFYIYDKGGNDSYVMKASRGDIYDCGGKDTLTIAGAKKSNIVFMTNYSLDSTNNADCSLIVYNKTNNSYTIINKFYKDDDADNLYDGYGDGRIETIKAGKKVLKNVPKADYFTDTLRTKVAVWLNANGYWNVDTALSNAFSQDKDISGLVAVFEGKAQ